MKLVINSCYGGFDINEKWKAESCGKNCKEDCRKCAKLIHAIEDRENVNGNYSRLAVVDFPDEATDYEILDYDGSESLLYVLDGKIRYA